MESLWFVTLVFGALLTMCVFLRNFIRFVYLSNKIPGPSLWEFLTVHAGRLIRGHTNMDGVIALSERSNFKPYGVWVKGGNFVYVVTDSESVGEVFKTMKNKPKILYESVSRVLGEGLITLPDPEHKRHQRLISPAFRKAALDTHLPRINEEVAKMIEEIQEAKACGDEVNVQSVLQKKAFRLSISILVSRTNYGYELEEHVEALKIGSTMVRAHAMHPFWAFIKWTRSFREKQSRLSKAMDVLERTFLEERTAAAERLKEDAREPVNVVECLAQNSGEDALTTEECIGEVKHILGASAESTEFAESVCLCLLALHPEVQQRVFDEVQSILGESDRAVDPDDISRMEYLEMVIKEAMRLFPPIPLMARKVDEEMNFRGILLPKGCNVFVDIISLHRNPDSFKDPLKFDPERFSVDQSVDRHPSAYLPFSRGKRACPGQVYAIMSLKTSLSRIIKKFKVYPTEGLKCIADIKCSINVTLIAHDIPLRFVSRNNNA